MQAVKFRNIGEILDFLPEDQLLITEMLREIVLETIPDIQEHLAYNIPYYKRHSNICFIWPGAIAWGSKTYPGVRFGFTRGHLLSDPYNYLDQGSRKQVYWRDFAETGEINPDILISYLIEASELDNSLINRGK